MHLRQVLSLLGQRHITLKLLEQKNRRRRQREEKKRKKEGGPPAGEHPPASRHSEAHWRSEWCSRYLCLRCHLQEEQSKCQQMIKAGSSSCFTPAFSSGPRRGYSPLCWMLMQESMKASEKTKEPKGCSPAPPCISRMSQTVMEAWPWTGREFFRHEFKQETH